MKARLALGLLVGLLAPPLSAQCPLDKLLAADGSTSDFLGDSVALSGDVVVLGAPSWDSDTFTDPGAAYVFERQGVDWVQTARLTADFATGFEHFGRHVDVEGDRVAVGVPVAFGFPPWGAVYVYVNRATGWKLEQLLTPALPGPFDHFGQELELEGDTLAVGAIPDPLIGIGEGRVYVFEREASGWVEKQLLHSPAPSFGDRFGEALSLDGGTLLVGARDQAPAGAAYVFVRTAGVWTHEATLVAPDAESGDRFGTAVAVSGDRALVGAPLDDDQGHSSGNAWIFERAGTTWTPVVKLFGSTAVSSSRFGESVDLDGARAVVSAPRSPGGGSVHVFEPGPSGWTETQTLQPADVTTNDWFGQAVRLDGGRLVTGAHRDSDGANSAGSAYLHDLDEVECRPLFGAPRVHRVELNTTQYLRIDAGPFYSGGLYLLAATSTGTSPGVQVDGVTVPLNPSPLFTHTLLHANLPPYAASFGFLDAEGRADATLTLPGGVLAPVAGATLHQAFVAVAIGGALPHVGLASNPEPLELR